MVLQFTPHTIPLFLATVLAVIGGINAWRRKEGPVELWGTIVQASVTAWVALMLLTVSFTEQGLKLAALSLYVPIGLLTTLSFFIFTLHFTGRSEWLSRIRLGVLLSLPLLALVLALTNSVHNLVFDNVDVVTESGYKQLTYTFGPGFYLLVGLTYAFIVTFLVMLLQQFRNSRNVYRKISFVLLVSLSTLTGASLLSSLGLSPLPHFLLLPYVYLVLGLFLIAGTSSVWFLRALPVQQLLVPFRRGKEGQIPTARAKVMEEIDGGIITLDGAGTVVDINTMAKKMIGAERPIGQHVSEIAPTDRITAGNTIKTVLESENDLRELSEEIWVDADDQQRCYAIRVSTLASDSGDAGYVVLMHDITQQKRREQELRERERELQRQNDRLERQKTQLEHQNQRLDQFAGIVSHDLRNPLNVAKGHSALIADMLAEMDDPPIDQEHAATTLSSLDRMEAIIEDALTLARQGKAITETEPVDLGEVIESSWETVDTAEAAIEYPRGVTIEADPGRLRNVFENLFRNSLEHGSDTVEIAVELLDEGFAIEDDGPGIPPEKQDTVFEEGFTTSDEGTGFGLAIVRDVVRAHGWDVSVSTASTGGARFEIMGVGFPWSKSTLAEKLEEIVGADDTRQLVEDAMSQTGVDRDKFDEETARSVLDTISNNMSGSRSVTAVSDLTQQIELSGE